MQKFIIVSFLIIPLLLTGCSAGKSNNNQQNTDQGQTQSTTREPMIIENENFTEGTLNNLKIGGKVLVVGIENSDGSIVSSQIITGENLEDFNNIGRNFMQNRNMGTSTVERATSTTGGQRFNAEQFQDMSEEERAQLRENMGRIGGNTNLSEEERARFMEGRTNRQATNGAPINRAGTVRVSGEIIDLGEGIITLKLENGGSKLVFFSEKTIINIINQ
jgi:hypothetical protein